MLHLNKLSYRYKPNLPWVLKDLQMSLPSQGVLGLLGHNGAGKSTLLSIIAGLYSLEQGSVSNVKQEKLDSQTLLSQVSIVPQDFAFYQSLTVLQNLQLFHRVANKTLVVDSLDQIIEVCLLSDLLSKQVSHLSGGQKRKLNLAIGLIKKANILLLDEPTVGIDPESKQELLKLIQALSSVDGKLIIYTSHILQEVEQVCDYFCILHDGELKLEPTAFDQIDDSQQAILQLQRKDDNKKLADYLKEMTTGWINHDTVVIKNLKSSSAQFLTDLEQAGIVLRSSSFGAGALEQLYFSLTRDESRDLAYDKPRDEL